MVTILQLGTDPYRRTGYSTRSTKRFDLRLQRVSDNYPALGGTIHLAAY
jgi:hypothetical protein